MQGTRLPNNTFLKRSREGTVGPGDYGAEIVTLAGSTQTQTDWFVCCPDGSLVRLWVHEDDRNGARHIITEHDDGSITVGGSIMGHNVASEHISGVGPISSPSWHGWLERGVWRSC